MTKTNCILVLCAFIPASLTPAAAAAPSQYNVRDLAPQATAESRTPRQSKVRLKHVQKQAAEPSIFRQAGT